MKDSDVVAADGRKMRQHRNSIGVKQMPIANAAGVSERTLRKIETGVPVRLDMIRAVIRVLHDMGESIDEADVLIDPSKHAEAFCEAYRQYEVQMVDHIEELISPRLVTFIAGDPSVIPFAGTYHGLGGLRNFWRKFFDLLERPDKQFLQLDYLVCGDVVAAYGRERGRIKGRNDDEPTWLCLKFTINEGLIVRFEDYFDTQSAHQHLEEFRKMQQRAAQDE